MPIQWWSDEILLLEMQEEPHFSEDLVQVQQQLDKRDYDVVASLADVRQINSTGMGSLLQLRQRLVEAGRQLRLCSVPDIVWGAFMVTAMDKVFEFSPDVPSALASLQLQQGEDDRGL